MASVREVKQDLDETRERVGNDAHSIKDSASEEMQSLREKLRANGEQLEDELRDAGARIADGAKTFSDAATDQIRENPLIAFGVAFAAGLVISRLLRRS